MKQKVKVSLIQFAPVWLHRAGNAARMAAIVEREAIEHGAELVVFPELATTGYLMPHLEPGRTGRVSEFTRRLHEEAELIPGPTTDTLGEVARRHEVHVIAGIAQKHPELDGTLYNAGVLIGPSGEVVGIQQKVHAAFEEKSFFVTGNAIPVFETALGTLAIEVCYDVRFPEVARIQALKGADIIVSIWAMYGQQDLVPTDSMMLRCSTRAMENGVYFLGCNRVGVENDTCFLGQSAAAGPTGRVIARSDNSDEDVLRLSLDGEALHEQRMYLTLMRDRRPDLYEKLIEQL